MSNEEEIAVLKYRIEKLEKGFEKLEKELEELKKNVPVYPFTYQPVTPYNPQPINIPSVWWDNQGLHSF